MKKTDSYIYNVTPIEDMEALRLTTWAKGEIEYMGTPSVYYGNSENPTNLAEDTKAGMDHSYNLHGASYFKIAAHPTYACYFESFSIV